MIRKTSVLMLLVFAVSIVNLFASDWVNIQSEQPSTAQIQLNYSNIQVSQLHFKLDGFQKSEVITERGNAWTISVESGVPILKEGAPELPLFPTSLIIPDLSEMKVEIISSQYEEYSNVLIAPSKGNLIRTVHPDDVPYSYGQDYSMDAFYPGNLGQLRDPYIVRDYRGQTVLFQPFQYNPVTKVLRVYYDIVLEVTEAGPARINPFNRTNADQAINKSFDEIYKNHFINAQSASRYEALDEHGNMLVISYGDFMEEVQDLVDWKIQTGTPVELVDVATIGNAVAIKQFIADYYNDNGLTFVLLVGDSQEVPCSSIGGEDSDNNYAYIVGNDHYPDVFVGRFSAQTEAHVVTQVTRTLQYEQTPISSDTTWYSDALGIASNEGPGDDNEYDYQHIRNIQDNKLIPWTYTYGYELFDGSQGGNDAPGNPNPSMVSSVVNDGVTIINYTGHGSTSAWSSSSFSSNNVNQLTNVGKWPFIISVACVNGNFVNSSCFAEAWLRAEDSGEPTGAVATLMSTINQSWNPPMHGQDEMNDILSEAYTDNIKRTFGGVTMNGCMGMNDAYGSAGDDMTDTWVLFGDPSLMVRTAIPEDMSVNHDASITIGETSLTINCNVEGALAAFTMDGEIYGSATVENGSATITFEPLSDIGTASVVVTAFNYVPYMGTIEIESMAPFVVYANNTLNDINGNSNGMADYSENIFMELGLTNVGTEDAYGVEATLLSSSQFITIKDADADYGDIMQGDTVSIMDGFEFDVANNVPDGGLISFSVIAEDDSGNAWQSNFMIISHAPVMEYESYSINDANGNGNGRLDPGETVDITVSIANSGSADAYNVMGQLSSISEFITINGNQQTFGFLGAGATQEAVYNVTVAGDAPEGTLTPFLLELIADHELTEIVQFSSVVGLTKILVVNLAESPSQDYMKDCFNTLRVAADEDDHVLADLSQYHSVFVLLGVFPDHHILDEAEGQLLADFLASGGRVYMEGGDTWVDDDPTAVHPMFYINGLDAGSDNLSIIYGEEGSMMEGYNFVYEGNNNYMDQIEAKGDAFMIFGNEAPEFVTGVAYENETYKTVGCSFEFAGLTDEEFTKDDVMAKILDFFNMYNAWTDVPSYEAASFSVAAYPNPFQGQLMIEINLDEASQVSVDIYDITGRKVTALTDTYLSEGKHSLQWLAHDKNAGIYFYTVKVGSEVLTQKLVLNR